MSARLTGKVVLVAGGTGELGRAASLAFHAHGAQVVVTYRQEEQFEVLKSEARGGLAIEGHRVDVTDEAAVNALVAALVARHGKIDVLVNAVGGYIGGINLWELEPRAFDRMLSLNLRSTYVLSRSVIPHMLERHSGAIVNVAAKAALDPPAGAAAYAASKAAALALLDSAAAELKGTGVRVNSILPSIIDTQPNREAMPNANFAKWPKPEDIAHVILFLCSEEGRVIHGAAVPVYGAE